uniref:Uncharacterized protein n=1 Tax=Anopheles atroparvus TaxID=41427 RepID=A0AAG5DHS4_ANOAO
MAGLHRPDRLVVVAAEVASAAVLAAEARNSLVRILHWYSSTVGLHRLDSLEAVVEEASWGEELEVEGHNSLVPIRR